MSPASSAERSSGRTIAAVVLAVIAIVFIVVGIIYLAVPAGSLPGFMGHESVKLHGQTVGSSGHHPLRAAGSLIVGVVFVVGAWFALKYQGKASPASGTATREPAARS